MISKQSPKGADNFRLITGINRSIERRLHKAGILTYGKLASMTPHAIVAILGDVNGVTTKRIAKEDWIKKARDLSSQPTSADSEVETVSQANFPSAKSKGVTTSFVVELSLDGEGGTRRTRVYSPDKAIEDGWDGWNERNLLNFIKERAGLRPSAAEAGMPTAKTAEHRPKARMVPEPVPARLTKPDPVPSVKSQMVAPPQAVVIATSAGESTFQKSVSIPAQANAASALHCANQSFKVHLALDRTEIASLKMEPLNYKANIYAKSLKGRQRQSVGEAEGRLQPTGTDTIIMDGSPLPQGLYRLQAVVSISVPTSKSEPKTPSTLQIGEKLLRIA